MQAKKFNSTFRINIKIQSSTEKNYSEEKSLKRSLIRNDIFLFRN